MRQQKTTELGALASILFVALRANTKITLAKLSIGIAVAQKRNLKNTESEENMADDKKLVGHTNECLGGWCQVGTYVYSNFYGADAEKPQKVTRVYHWNDEDGRVWTEGNPENGAKPLVDASFEDWIRQEPITGAGKKKE